jgi:predicted ATPase
VSSGSWSCAEHVLSCAAALATLVRSCPELVVLAASRVPMRLQIEQEVRVAPPGPRAGADLFMPWPAR